MENKKLLFGLIMDSKIKIRFNLETQQIMEVSGIDISLNDLEISESKCFQIPTFIKLHSIPFYPTKYEIISDGDIFYTSNTMPTNSIQLQYENSLMLRAKEKRFKVTLADLVKYDISNRRRDPSQNQVMGMSANQHAEDLMNKGILKIGLNKVKWHWCHLIGFSLFAPEKAQKRNNLICGTSAFNGHMTNIETAVKQFIYTYNRPLGLWITAEYLADTQIATRLRYRVHDINGSQITHAEYFDALTDVKTDLSDFRPIYQRMIGAFSN